MDAPTSKSAASFGLVKWSDYKSQPVTTRPQGPADIESLARPFGSLRGCSRRIRAALDKDENEADGDGDETTHIYILCAK